MFINTAATAKKSRRAWTLAEMSIAVGVFSVAGLAVSTIFMFSVRSFAALTNYAMLDKENRVAMDKLTQEIRQSKLVLNYTTNSGNSLTLLNGDNQQVTYTFSANNKQMLRTVNGNSEVLLTNCDLLSFSLFVRPPTNSTFEVYYPANGDWSNSVKIVQLTWKTSMTLPNAAVNSENVQTARVVIRKQQDN